ncbi:MAG TPA: rhomboid family intramembrane serine protease [Steroidobacteraceae bacterium]|nr:rhomboid family intramembrane serine protease [Steroidobacteraceae bacterium]
MSTALLIFGATIVASLVALYAAPALMERCVFRPYWLLRRKQYETLVTSGFVHADIPHLAFNMITFWFFAFPLERRIGSTAFAVLYFAALVLSDAGTFLKHRHDPNYASLGASGAISAVLFANIVYFPTQSLFIFPIPVPIPAPLFAVGYVAYTWYSARQARGRINHDAHLGGALFGLLFVLLTDPAAYGALLGNVPG